MCLSLFRCSSLFVVVFVCSSPMLGKQVRVRKSTSGEELEEGCAQIQGSVARGTHNLSSASRAVRPGGRQSKHEGNGDRWDGTAR